MGRRHNLQREALGRPARWSMYDVSSLSRTQFLHPLLCSGRPWAGWQADLACLQALACWQG